MVQGSSSYPERSSAASADSIVNPPSNTESCAKAALSGSDSRSQDQSKVERSVACRSRRPPVEVSSLKRSLMRESSVLGGITRTRAAANSIASSRHSSSFTSGAMAALSSSVGWKSRFADSARCTKSTAASGAGSGASARVSSPTSPSTSRVVTTKRACVARLSHLPSVSSA